jgi:23S rRNA (uridine2552-2'-O)-methyltransferase
VTFNPQDHYFKKAKKEGYLARSAYKLDEIQQKYRVLRPGQKILDLGCAPGAWSQIILENIGQKGFLRGVDLKAVTLRAANAEFIVKDIYQMELAEFKEAPYDVIVSDMAPNTTGIMIRDQTLSEELCLKVIDLCDQHLRLHGHMVMKLFQGGGAKEVETAIRKRFTKMQLFKPKSTRKESKEIFVIGLDKRNIEKKV